MTEPFSEAEMTDAFRTAMAMAHAARRIEPKRVAELWNQAPNRRALIWALARLPGVFLEKLGADADYTVDVELELEKLMHTLATFEPPTEEGK